MMSKYIGEGGKDRDGVGYHCVDFLLLKIAPVEVIVRLDNNIYNNNSIELKINEEESVKITSPVHHFTEE